MIKGYPFKLVRELSYLHAPTYHAMEVEYAEILYNICCTFDAPSILEIGTANGHTTWWFTQVPNAHVTSVDINLALDIIFEPVLNSNNVFFVKEDSKVFLDNPPKKYDFILIDGDHDYPACAEDISLGRCALNPGGILAVHDTVLYPESVGRAVMEHKNFGVWTHWIFGKGLSYVRT